MIDISMAGAVVTIEMDGLPKGFTISEFAEDSDPISIPDLEVRKGGMNLNGKLISWASPNPVSVSFSIIPGSQSDLTLCAALRAAHIGGVGNNIGNAYVKSLTITVPLVSDENSDTSFAGRKSKSWTFINGYISSGSPAQGSNGEGRASTKTYTFVFEGFSQETTKKLLSTQP